jgi:uncharacterized phage protein (TIGR02220 family)
MGIKRVVDIGFWTDDKVVNMFSPEDKYFMLYLLTNPHTTQIGIYPFNVKIAAFETGYSQEAILVLLDRFQSKYNILKWSNETGEIAIRNFLKHSIIKGGKPVFDCLKREYKGVKNKALLVYVWESVKDSANETVLQFFDSININELENDNDIDNDNDNDNDVSWTIRGRFVDESSKPKVVNMKRNANKDNIVIQNVINLYNEICVSLPSVLKVTDRRKSAINARLKDGYTMDDFKNVFELAEKSDFLTGENDNGWTANLDWLMNPTNIVKVLEGNYKNKPSSGKNSHSHTGYGNGANEAVNKQGTYEERAEEAIRNGWSL